jgi:hypothetical protein
MLNLDVQAGEIESVKDVVLFDLTKVFVAFVRQEP